MVMERGNYVYLIDCIVLLDADIHHRQNAFDWPDGEEELSHQWHQVLLLLVAHLIGVKPSKFELAEIRSIVVHGVLCLQ